MDPTYVMEATLLNTYNLAKAALFTFRDAETQTDPCDAYEEIINSPGKRRLKRALIHASTLLSSPPVQVVGTPPSNKKRARFADDPLSCKSLNELEEDFSPMSFKSGMTNMTFEVPESVGGEIDKGVFQEDEDRQKRRRTNEAVTYVINKRSDGEDPKMTDVANLFCVPRTTLIRKLAELNESEQKDWMHINKLKKNKNGSVDMKSLRSKLLRMHMDRNGGCILKAQSRFRGVTTQQMIDQLTPESATKIRTLCNSLED